MKNRIKLIGIVVTAAIICLSMSGCDIFKKGGTLEIVNQTGGRIQAWIYLAETTVRDQSSYKYIENNQTETWSFDENYEGYYDWIGVDGNYRAGEGATPKKVSIKNEETVTITAKR